MQYCPKCNLTVAPQDPDRVVKGNQTFHKNCLKKQEPVQVMQLIRPAKQRYFRFVAAQMVH